MNSDDVKVSVCVVTYNQEQYIEQCLQSLVDQETNFKFEIIVSDDCSKDRTPEIIREFQKKYPNIIKPILHEKNMGALKNFVFVHQQAVGEYIAHMDGDDYALPGKLQIQADFLDENPKCNIVFHQMDYIQDGVYIKSKRMSGKMKNYNFFRKDIIKYGAIGANSSKMYRSELQKIELPSFDLVDYTVNVIQVGDGYAAYCGDSALGVYRRAIGIAGSVGVNMAVVNSLYYFLERFPEYRKEINVSSIMWFISNVKYNKSTKWKFGALVLKTFTLLGFLEYVKNRSFQKELSGL